MPFEYYRWNTEKYRKATRHLTAFQHGCYRLLIDEYMETREPLPDNDQALANICHCTLEEFSKHASSILRAFFRHKNGLLYHNYCDQELDYQDGKTKYHSERAKKAAEARYSKNKDLHANSMPLECLAMLDKRVENRDIDTEDKSSVSTPLPPKEFDALFPEEKKGKKETEKAVELYNLTAKKIGIPIVQKLSETRKTKLRNRLKDCGGLDGWAAALAKLEKIPAMRGDNDRGWKADFDFLVAESSFIKLMEGKYDEWGSRKTGSERTKQQLQDWVEGR